MTDRRDDARKVPEHVDRPQPRMPSFDEALLQQRPGVTKIVPAPKDIRSA